ncbi:MAG: OmpA family protein [Steroidobacteraceae bacterium]|nr:OmpA family protein [Steroidobacteraceae bacterium]
MITRSKVGVMSAVAVSVALAGCASVEDFAQNPEKQKTRQGTAIGAVGGVAVGLIAGGGWQGALIGAGVGALAGGLAGNYMDKQEAKLRQQMAGTGVEVVRMGDNLTLSMPGNVTFAFDSAQLNPQFDSVLDKLAQTLSEYNKTVIQVAGHTDSTGSHAYNMKLSLERADSVKAYLESRGVPGSRLVTIGAGPDYPIASNDTEEGRAQNRRVEITIVPVTQDELNKAK